jgi:hypothetical protein
MARCHPFNSFVVVGFRAYLFLTQGKKTVIDLRDLEKALQYRWCAQKNHHTWYAVANGPNKVKTRLHNFLTGINHVDHIDGDGLNNLRWNLRSGDNGVNQRNQKDSGRNTSGFRGVHQRKDTGRFQAAITIDSKTMHLGHYATAEEAARVYDEAAKRYCPGVGPRNFLIQKDDLQPSSRDQVRSG